MSVNQISPPYITFKDVDGNPLESGYVYIGVAGLNAEASPQTVYWDADRTIPASQPIRTTGGFPVYLGSPSKLFIDGDYSIVVKDRRLQLVQSALTSGLGIVGPDGISISFETIAAFEAATIQSDITFVMAAGLKYEEYSGVNEAVTSNGGARKWVPTEDEITIRHFKGVGDGITDDYAAIISALAYCGELSTDAYFDQASDSLTFPGQVVLTGGGGVFAVSQTVDLQAENSGILIENTDFVALDSGLWATTGGTATTERQSYRPQKSDHMFESKSNCTYVVFKGCRLNCNNLCGGVTLRSRGRFFDGFIKKCAGVGVRGLSGDVWVSRAIIGQWDQNDAQFWDEASFTGIGVLCEVDESDMRLSDSVIRWLHECVRFDATNCNVWDCHIFNGAENYVASDRGAFTTEMLAALDNLFGAGPNWDTYDFPARTYHAGVVTSGETGLQFKDNCFSGIYFDNCHNEHYSDRVTFSDIRLAAKLANTDPSRGAPDYWWRFYCNVNGANPDFSIQVARVLVETVEKKMVTLVAYDGNSWEVGYNSFEASRYNEGASDAWADGFVMGKPTVFVNVQSQTGFPSHTYHGPQTGSFLGFSDVDTNLDTTGDPVSALFGARGDNSIVRQLSDFIAEVREVDGSGDPTDVYREIFRALSDGNIRLPAPTPPANASSTGVEGDVSWDADFIYVCTASNTWKRVAIATW